MAYLLGKALPHQYEFINSEARFTALVSGLGAGKTEALVYSVLKDLTEIPKAVIGIFAPTTDLFKRIHYPRFEEIFANSGIPYKFNKTDGVMDVFMPNGRCQIIFRSMENPARIIGFELVSAYLDELDVLHTDKAMDVWIRVLARTRKKFLKPDGTRGKNKIGVTTTPEGHKFTYNMWMRDHIDNPDYKLIRGKTKYNYHLPEDYVQTLIETYPPQLVKAYLEGEFVSMSGNLVYPTFDRYKSNTDYTLDDFPTHTLHLGADFNIGRSAVCTMVKGDEGQMYILDEMHHLMDTPAMVAEIQNRYKGRTIIMYPDASGRSRKSVDSSKSDHKLLRDAGFRIKARAKNPPVRERVVSVQTAFENGAGERRLFINVRKCPNLTLVMEQGVFDDNSAPLKDGKEDPADALGYVVNSIAGLARPQASIARMRFGV